MIRRIFCFFISALFLLSFAACSPTQTGPTDSSVPSDPGTVSSASSGAVSDPVPSDATTDPDSDQPSASTEETHDILTTPIAQLTADEQEALADYLFEKYIPCSYGIFSNAKNLSSASVWSSVEALNRVIDGDESEASRKLENVLKKVEIYYPGTAFDPAKVRLYDADTQSFAASPAEDAEYVMLSHEVREDQITIYYEDMPDGNDPDTEPEQYATTLKNSTAEGYFAFVSSVKTGAVG